MILDLKDNEEESESSILNGLSEITSINSIKGPVHVSSQEFKPKGDLDYNR